MEPNKTAAIPALIGVGGNDRVGHRVDGERDSILHTHLAHEFGHVGFYGALFDSEGGYVAGTRKTVNLRLSDETLAKPDPGITLHWEFDVKSADYLVRLVVREAESKAMTAINRSVAIH